MCHKGDVSNFRATSRRAARRVPSANNRCHTPHTSCFCLVYSWSSEHGAKAGGQIKKSTKRGTCPPPTPAMSSSPSADTPDPHGAEPSSPPQSSEHQAQSQLWSLETQPTVHDLHRGRIPNTPLASATISFVLGSIFALAARALLLNLGLSAALFDFVKEGKVAGGTLAFNRPLVQLSFFLVVWPAFHWGEFAVTAGWNRARATVDCTCLGFLGAGMEAH
jgi:hypothetical protein